jgi:hypothetical protein
MLRTTASNRTHSTPAQRLREKRACTHLAPQSPPLPLTWGPQEGSASLFGDDADDHRRTDGHAERLSFEGRVRRDGVVLVRSEGPSVCE